jgi:uncharacterized membrane protein YciS (DUF1049 family)
MKIILFVALLVIGIIFATQNNMPVTVKFYTLILEGVTLYSVILLSVFFGFIGGAIYSYIDCLKLKGTLRNERKLKKELEEELENLRTLPLTSDDDIEEDVDFMEQEEDIIKATD